MRILTKPKVYLIGRPQLNEEGLQAFLDDNDLEWPTPLEGVKDCERIVETAGRTCYMSYGSKAGNKTNKSYIDNLIGVNRSGPAHGSVVEHVNWTFVVTGASRGFSHELARHRVGVGLSQLSTRYCDFEREGGDGTWDPGFCIPPLAMLSESTQRNFENFLKASVCNYTKMLHQIEFDLKNNKEFMDSLGDKPERERATILRKAARGAARELLPIATEAIITFTANARAIWNMAYLRASEHAEAVIRDVFVQIVKIMEEEMPALFNSIVYEKMWDRSTVVTLPREKL